MKKEAIEKLSFPFSHSKILLPSLLLLLAWIITIFTFYIYQTPKTSVEGIAVKKFSNLNPSPVVTHNPTVVVYSTNHTTLSATSAGTLTPSITNSKSASNNSVNQDASPTTSPVPTVSPTPTFTPTDGKNNCVKNKNITICYFSSPTGLALVHRQLLSAKRFFKFLPLSL